MQLTTKTLEVYDVGEFNTLNGSNGRLYASAVLYRQGAIYPLELVWKDCVLRFDNTEINGVEVHIKGAEIRSEPDSYHPGRQFSVTQYNVTLVWDA